MAEVATNKTYTSLADLTNALHQSSQVSSSIVIFDQCDYFEQNIALVFWML